MIILEIVMKTWAVNVVPGEFLAQTSTASSNTCCQNVLVSIIISLSANLKKYIWFVEIFVEIFH